MTTPIETPDPDRLGDRIEQLSTFATADAPGWTRRVFTEEYRAGREWIAAEMRATGLEVHTDTAGNLIGILRGTGGGRALVTGSHTDTVHGGGRFDGVLGVLGGLEAIECIRAGGTRLDHDLWLVDFLGEEPNDFGLSCLGSRGVTGALNPADLGLLDPSGRSLGDALRESGHDPGATDHGWPEVSAFVELHVEQGPHLEDARTTIGVVSEIVGVHRFKTRFTGRRDHAGTTPMDRRHDAFAAAADAVLAVEAAASDGGGVATCGHVEVVPGAMNVVPERADLWTEIRSADADWLADRHDRFANAVRAAGERRGVVADLEVISRDGPVPAAGGIGSAILRGAERVGQPTMALPSGAEHDSALMARMAPMGMIFVPSRDGRSHCPEEWTDIADACAGVHVLAETLVGLDRDG